MTTTVYGTSDGDAINLDGDVDTSIDYESNQDDDGNDEGMLLMFSDSTVLQVDWGKDLDQEDGDAADIWTLTVKNVGFLFDRIEPCTDTEANPPSDIVHFKDGIRWVYVATGWVRVLAD